MKLGKDVLLEIVAIVQEGLVEGKDISQDLRDLDLVEGELITVGPEFAPPVELHLSRSYLESKGRN